MQTNETAVAKERTIREVGHTDARQPKGPRTLSTALGYEKCLCMEERLGLPCKMFLFKERSTPL